MENPSKVAFRVSRVSICGNVVLSAVKLAAGLLARSGAMVSDAVHSLSDVFSTVIVMIGVRFASKESDKEHPYGHERMECVAAIVLSGILLVTGLMIGYRGVQSIRHAETLEAPGLLALAAAILSIVVKEAMYRWTRSAAKHIESEALMAEAWHQRSDALSSIGALVGIAGARLGFPALDPIASLVICLFIVKAAYEIFRDAVNKMVDESVDEKTENAIRAVALAYPGVAGVDRLLTRKFGSKMYIEMEISVNGDLPLTEAHAIAENVHNEIEKAFPKVKHIMIHENPANGADGAENAQG